MLKKALALMLLSATPAIAAKECANAFRNAGQGIPYALERAGYSQVGGINISSLRRNMSGIPVTSTTRAQIKAANRDGWSNGRTTARWEVNGNQSSISVACDWWGSFRSKEFLALHEYLGVLGYDDDDYQISVGLWLLANPTAQARLTDREKSAVEKGIARQAHRQMARGGVVGVGGGGEGTSGLSRIVGMERALRELNQAQSEAGRRDAIYSLQRALNSNSTFHYE